MLLQINTVELVLRSDSRLQVIYDEGYELSFESSKGLQIAINRKSTVKAIRLWIQNTIDPRVIELSSTAKVVHYPASRPRAHLSAPRLLGPYDGRPGNDCWYIALQQESDLWALLAAYLK